MYIPGRIGKHDVLIAANVVENELPLLLSKPSLKKIGAVIDFVNDTMKFMDETVQLLETKSGHYCIPICNKKKLVCDNMVKKPYLVLTLTEEAVMGKNKSEMQTKALKLHKQFSHASADKLIVLLKNAGYTRDVMFQAIEDVCRTCEICQRYKKPKPRPVVGLPRGKTFNDIVAMDLKCLDGINNVYFLHMIDMVTRFSAAKIIRDKKKETIVSGLFSKWISVFGAPQKFMADNGGEFSNDAYRELCEQYNIQIQYSAAESPFSNGMVERHHKVLTEMLTKTKEDAGCSWEIALSWALNAKNSMQMFGGYSSYQMLFGRNPGLPNLVDNKLPALEEPTVSKVVSDNVHAMHKAREEFVSCESKKKLRKALKSNVRTCNDEYFDNGEKVLYKRNNSNVWHGPAVVIGREAQSILIKHGNQYVKVHPAHTTRFHNDRKEKEKPETTNSVPKPVKPNLYIPLETECETNVSQDDVAGIQTDQDNRANVTGDDIIQPVDNVSVNHQPQPSNSSMGRTSNPPSQLPKPKSYVKFLPKYPAEDGEGVWETARERGRGRDGEEG